MRRRATRRRNIQRKRVGRRRLVTKRRGGRKASLSINNQRATIVETLAANDVFPDTPYQATFNLSQFFRATTVAKNFKFYRAKKVKWEYMPLYNTFQENNAVAAVGQPQFYFMMDRDQDTKFQSLAPIDALFSIQTTGADPTPFTKNKEIIYTPNWCSPGLTAVGYTAGTPPNPNTINAVYSLGLKKQFGWLPTPNKDAWQNPETVNEAQNPLSGFSNVAMSQILNGAVVYNGHNLYIQQDNDPEVPIGKCIITVEWEFKGGKQLYATPIPTLSQPSESAL